MSYEIATVPSSAIEIVQRCPSRARRRDMLRLRASLDLSHQNPNRTTPEIGTFMIHPMQ